MASATTRLAFSFHHHHHLLQSSRAGGKNSSSSSLHLPPLRKYKHSSISCSIEVSKEDKSTPQPPTEAETSGGAATVEEEKQEEEEEENLLDPKRRLEERFAVLNTGIYECRSCGYRYDQAVGDPAYPIAPGFQFEKLPEDWRCPTCGAAKTFFQSKSVEIAGFAQNQKYGLGSNTLTAGQKALLIYGGLLAAFALFLSGYFLQ